MIYFFSSQDEEIWAEREKVDEILLDALERKILENGEASRKVIASNSEKIAVQFACPKYLSVQRQVMDAKMYIFFFLAIISITI